MIPLQRERGRERNRERGGVFARHYCPTCHKQGSKRVFPRGLVTSARPTQKCILGQKWPPLETSAPRVPVPVLTVSVDGNANICETSVARNLCGSAAPCGLCDSVCTLSLSALHSTGGICGGLLIGNRGALSVCLPARLFGRQLSPSFILHSAAAA